MPRYNARCGNARIDDLRPRHEGLTPVFALHGRGVLASPDTKASPTLQRRMLVAGPVVAVVSVIAAVLATDAAGIPLRDPDHVAGRRLVFVLGLVAVLIALDMVIRATRRSPTPWPSLAALEAVRRERWTARRGIAVGSALISFYITYL